MAARIVQNRLVLAAHAGVLATRAGILSTNAGLTQGRAGGEARHDVAGAGHGDHPMVAKENSRAISLYLGQAMLVERPIVPEVVALFLLFSFRFFEWEKFAYSHVD
jgi:hypothetical protein